tara:strand:+ start:1120 stop:1740 length:621 start_codon:yes stop_codon:yes gene_type:complete
MVRNLTGGSKHKSQARKNVVPRGGASGTLRVAQEEGECFAQVERMLGGSNCHVKCVDGVVRLCVIRGKFRGKGKRDNVLSMGSIVLVGMRDYESCKGKDKLETCDLLEVYREADKTRLFSSVKIDWSEIVTAPGCTGEKTAASSSAEEGFSFMTDAQIEMERLIHEQEENIIARTSAMSSDTKQASQNDNRTLFGDDEEDVDVDDI